MPSASAATSNTTSERGAPVRRTSRAGAFCRPARDGWGREAPAQGRGPWPGGLSALSSFLHCTGERWSKTSCCSGEGCACSRTGGRAQGERGLHRPPPQKSNGRGVLGRCHSICRIPHNHRAAGQNAPAPGRGARGEARWPSRHRGRGQWAGQRRGDRERRRAGSRAFQSSIGAPCPLPMQRRGRGLSGLSALPAVRIFSSCPCPQAYLRRRDRGARETGRQAGASPPPLPPQGGFPDSPPFRQCGFSALVLAPRPVSGAGTGG